MLSKVERFFHLRTGMSHGGATVLVTGDTENIGKVTVQASFCSKKDVFCKKTGRDVARAAKPQEVSLRDLPRTIADVSGKMPLSSPWYSQGDYGFAIRYFLPR